MSDLKKQILLKLYEDPGNFVDIKPLLLKTNPSHHDLVYSLKQLKKDKIIEGEIDFRYSGIIKGKVPKIADHEFVFRLTQVGERIVRERYFRDTYNAVGFSGNVIGDNFQNNTINVTSGSNTKTTQINHHTPKKNNRFLQFIAKFWWYVIVGVGVGLTVLYLATKLNL